MKNIFLLLSLIILSGCTENNDGDVSSTTIDLLFMLEYKNEQGEDLLNPLTKGAWKTDEIQFFALDEGGFPIILAKEKINHFVNMAEDKGQKKYCIWFVYSYFVKDATTSVVYIALPNGDTDKIEVRAKRGKNSLVKDQLLYNDVLVWDRSHLDDRIVIIK